MNHCTIAYSFYEIDYRVRRYSEALVDSGNRIDAIALRKCNAEKKGIFNGVNIYRIQKRNFDEKGRFSYFFRILSFFVKGFITLTINHLRYRYHIIHIHSVPDFLVFMGLIPKLFGAKIILDIHDILPEFYCQKFNQRTDSFLARSLLFIEKLSVNFADHVIVANDLWRKKIIDRSKIPSAKCTTMLNYPNLEHFKIKKYETDRETFKIIYPGHLSQHHGLDIGIKAMAIVKQEIPTIRLDIYTGSYISEYAEFLKELTNELDLQKNIHFHDSVTIEELAKIYTKVDIGIVTKRAGVFSSEAFSTKIFDFMAAGIPTIASKTKIDEFYFDDSMIMFFEPENHEDMAQCIIELYYDPKKRQSLSDHAKSFVAKNNWEDKKEIYFNITNMLMGSKEQSPKPKQPK